MGRRDDERGAAAIFLALVICFVLLPITALTVDVGTQRVARRDAQAMADTGAQDAARALGSGTTSQSSLLSTARASIANSTSYVGSSAPTVDLFLGTLSTTFVSDQSLGCGASPYNSYFRATPAGMVSDAVLVTVSNTASFNFFPGSGGVCRSAIARAFKTACMTMNSYAAALKSNDSAVLGPITKILGTSIDTTVLSDSGILSTDLDVLNFLGVLKTQLNLASTDAVLGANVTAAQLLQAQQTALTQQGASSTAIAALNSQVASKLGPLANKQPGINVGELLGVTQGGPSALGTTVNAFDLAAAGVQLANGTNPVALSIALPSGLLGSTSVNATIGSRPTRVCLGDGTRKMGQTSASAELTLNTSNSLVLNAVNGLTTGLQNIVGSVLCLLSCVRNDVSISGISVKATASLAQASGRVDALNCTGATPNSLSIRQESSLAPFKVSVTLNLENRYVRRGFLGSVVEGPTVTATTFTLNLTTADPDDPTRNATLLVPDDYGKAKPGPSGDLSVGSLSVESQTAGADAGNIVAGLLGGSSNLITNTMSLLVNPILGSVLSPLLSELTRVLQATVGLTVAGSSYTPLPTPSCGTPALVG